MPARKKSSSSRSISFNSKAMYLSLGFIAAVALYFLYKLLSSNILGISTFAASCTPTGFFRDGINMTAALINPANATGEINAQGCNIGVYFDKNGNVNNATIYGANYFGVLVNGDVNQVSVDVKNSTITNIGENPLNGSQHGVGIYYRNFGQGSTKGKISGNAISKYQKGGIVANGANTNVNISDNTVTGEGPVGYIAQNGIQVGYGASAQVMKNSVSGNSYTGTSTVSGGIIVVGGPGYGNCVGTTPCAYSTNSQIDSNTVANNDVGIWLSNIDTSGNSPTSATNNKVVNNTITSDGLHNNYAGSGYQAGIADQGYNDKMIGNRIYGDGYNPELNPGAYTVGIDADSSFTNKPKVHANDVTP